MPSTVTPRALAMLATWGRAIHSMAMSDDPLFLDVYLRRNKRL
ncbi:MULTISPECIES: hypothetical protein [unclassified Mycobacterium]|nr:MULTISPECIES: hypothetical protein [unclassified Mycobacterium]